MYIIFFVLSVPTTLSMFVDFSALCFCLSFFFYTLILSELLIFICFLHHKKR